MKVMKYFAAASLMLFAACNNEDNPTLETGNQPVDVIVSLNTIQVGTRAAMGGLQDKVEDQAAASLEKVHVLMALPFILILMCWHPMRQESRP